MSSTITEYASDGMEVAEKSRIVVMSAVADIDAITAAEWNAGTSIECATTAFGISTDPVLRDVRLLCDKITRQRVARRNYATEELLINIKDPQASDTLMTMLAEDATVYIAHRPGITHDTAVASGQKYEAIKAIVSVQRLMPINADDGTVYQVGVQLLVQDKNYGLFASIAAA